MKCATCLKPQLKKACLRNKALRSAGNLAALDESMPPGDDLALAAPASLNRCTTGPQSVLECHTVIHKGTSFYHHCITHQSASVQLSFSPIGGM